MAGSLDLFAGTESIQGSNLWHVDRNPLDKLEVDPYSVYRPPEGLGVAAEETVKSLDSVVRSILGLSSTVRVQLAQVGTYFGNVEAFLGKLNPLDPSFDPVTAAKNFVKTVLHPTNMLAPLLTDPRASAGVVGVVPLENLPLAEIAEALGINDLAARLARLESAQ